MKIRVYRYPQLPWNKSIPFEVESRLTRYADKLEVISTVSTLGGIKVKPRRRVYYNVSTRTVKSRFSVIPKTEGTHRISFVAVVNRGGVIESVSASMYLRLQNELRVVPFDIISRRLYLWYNFNIILTYVFLLVLGLYLLVTIVTRFLRRWLIKQFTKAV